MKTLKRRFGEAYMLYKIRAGRGSVFTGELEGLQNAINKGGTLILLLSAYFHWLPPLWILPVLWLLQKIFEYGMGWYDEKHLGWWRFSSEYEQRNINPWNQEVITRLEKIEKHQELILKAKYPLYVVDGSKTKGRYHARRVIDGESSGGAN